MIGVLVTFTHICLLVESSVADHVPSRPTDPCKILEKQTFWKVAQVVCIALELKKLKIINDEIIL